MPWTGCCGCRDDAAHGRGLPDAPRDGMPCGALPSPAPWTGHGRHVDATASRPALRGSCIHAVPWLGSCIMARGAWPCRPQCRQGERIAPAPTAPSAPACRKPPDARLLRWSVGGYQHRGRGQTGQQRGLQGPERACRRLCRQQGPVRGTSARGRRTCRTGRGSIPHGGGICTMEPARQGVGWPCRPREGWTCTPKVWTWHGGMPSGGANNMPRSLLRRCRGMLFAHSPDHASRVVQPCRRERASPRASKMPPAGLPPRHGRSIVRHRPRVPAGLWGPSTGMSRVLPSGEGASCTSGPAFAPAGLQAPLARRRA